jgi:hypothetical protein
MRRKEKANQSSNSLASAATFLSSLLFSTR